MPLRAYPWMDSQTAGLPLHHGRLESGELLGCATDAMAQATLDPGQLSGPVRIGSRDILDGVFRA